VTLTFKLLALARRSRLAAGRSCGSRSGSATKLLLDNRPLITCVLWGFELGHSRHLVPIGL
jgi:hypothetical protein